MKRTSIEIISTEKDLIVYKNNRTWKRALALTLCDRTPKIHHDFPENQDHMRINGAITGGHCILASKEKGIRGYFKDHAYHAAFSSTTRRVVISGSGRCGTQAVAHFLDRLPGENGLIVHSRHETLHEYILPLIVEKNLSAITEILNGMQHEIETAPYFALCPETIRADLVLHIVRDGRRVVQSGMNRGWYSNDRIWNRIKPAYADDRFENCCHLWRATTESMTQCAHHTFRLEELIVSDEAKSRLLRIAGLKHSDKPFPHANKGNSSSDFSHWTDQQRDQFARICGASMDLYYPGWEREWAYGRHAKAPRRDSGTLEQSGNRNMGCGSSAR